MSFAKFLQGALRGATEQMPAAFERHDARKKFEQQMQMQRSQFNAEMGLKQKEVDELGRRNVILESHNKAQQELDREIEDARQQGREREFWTTVITGTVSEVELEALRTRLPDVDQKMRGTYEALIESRIQQLAFKAEQRYQELITKATLTEVYAYLKEGDTDSALRLANTLPNGGGSIVSDWVKESSKLGTRTDPTSPEAIQQYELMLKAREDWATMSGLSQKPPTAQETVAGVQDLFNQALVLHGYKPTYGPGASTDAGAMAMTPALNPFDQQPPPSGEIQPLDASGAVIPYRGADGAVIPYMPSGSATPGQASTQPPAAAISKAQDIEGGRGRSRGFADRGGGLLEKYRTPPATWGTGAG
mgnify:FL=1